jgi:ketosteroid isomerase-like protein
VSSNAERAGILVRALQASIAGETAVIPELYTDDVRTWAPAQATSSAAELATEFERRDEAFSDVDLTVIPLDVGGDYAAAEWTVAMTHDGPLTVADGNVVEPTGNRITLHGVTVAEFRGDRICSLRQYWDELSVFEQLAADSAD